MPTTYSARLDHSPLDFGAELDAISAAVERAKEQIRLAFSDCSVELEEEDVAILVGDVKLALTNFATQCSALPLRTPTMLIGTVNEIARQPELFLQNSGKYDPEAAALVLAECAKSSPEHRLALLRYEIGEGQGPGADAITAAAIQALAVLKNEARSINRGRPRAELQGNLAADLAGVFLNAGGHLGRTVHAGETGPFHRFLAAVIPAVRPFARRAGFELTIETMVRKARRKRQASRRLPPASSPPD